MGFAPRCPHAELQADGKRPAHDAENDRDGSGDDQGMTKVQLFYLAGLAAYENDIHREYGSEAVMDRRRISPRTRIWHVYAKIGTETMQNKVDAKQGILSIAFW